MQARRIANQIWIGLTSPGTTLLILLVLFVIQVTSLVLPQIPISASQGTAYARWLAELRPRLGTWTGTLASLGLLTVRSSPIMRAMLAILGLLIAAHLDGLREARQRGAPRPVRTGFMLLALGGLLIIGGWGAQMLWGWQESSAIVWPGNHIELPHHHLTLEQPKGILGLWRGRPGIYVLGRGNHTGLEVRASRGAAPILLLPSVDQEPLEVLRLTLAAQEPEAFFATEEAALIFRVIRSQGEVQIQVYRSLSGEIVAEATLNESEGARVLTVDDAEITFASVKLPYYEVIYNPGAIFEAIGMASLAAGTVVRIKLSKAEDPAVEE
jgi:hypothetical protein